MTRIQFEKRFEGDWKVKRGWGGSYRQNGKLITAVRPGEKIFIANSNSITSRTWAGIAKQL